MINSSIGKIAYLSYLLNNKCTITKDSFRLLCKPNSLDIIKSCIDCLNISYSIISSKSYKYLIFIISDPSSILTIHQFIPFINLDKLTKLINLINSIYPKGSIPPLSSSDIIYSLEFKYYWLSSLLDNGSYLQFSPKNKYLRLFFNNLFSYKYTIEILDELNIIYSSSYHYRHDLKDKDNVGLPSITIQKRSQHYLIPSILPLLVIKDHPIFNKYF